MASKPGLYTIPVTHDELDLLIELVTDLAKECQGCDPIEMVTLDKFLAELVNVREGGPLPTRRQ